MCEPVTIAAIGMALTAGSGIVAAKTQYDTGKMEARIEQNNARVADAQAKNALIKGAQEDQQQRWKIRALAGRQSAAIGANNVVGSTGTSLDILGETAMFGEVDLTTIRNNAAREAWGYQTEASNRRFAAKAAKYRGKSQAFGTLLSTGAQVAGMWPT